LRHQRERARKIRGGVFWLALREQNAAEIVASFRLFRFELQHAFVQTYRVVEFAQAFALGCVDEQFFYLVAGGVSLEGTGRPPLLVRGAPLFAIHRQ